MGKSVVHLEQVSVLVGDGCLQNFIREVNKQVSSFGVLPYPVERKGSVLEDFRLTKPLLEAELAFFRSEDNLNSTVVRGDWVVFTQEYKSHVGDKNPRGLYQDESNIAFLSVHSKMLVEGATRGVVWVLAYSLNKGAVHVIVPLSSIEPLVSTPVLEEDSPACGKQVRFKVGDIVLPTKKYLSASKLEHDLELEVVFVGKNFVGCVRDGHPNDRYLLTPGDISSLSWKSKLGTGSVTANTGVVPMELLVWKRT